MHIDLAKPQALTRAIDVAGGPRQVARLEAQRARIDERFDPRKALAATVRYLKLAEARFGRSTSRSCPTTWGSATWPSVLADYNGGAAVPYVQLYFDTAPDHHGAAYGSCRRSATTRGCTTGGCWRPSRS